MGSDRFNTLVYWMREREKIRILKEAGGSRPWTADPILNEWRFCNVNRCDDTVTRWIFERIIAKHKDSPTLWFNLIIARLVNWPSTLAVLGYYDRWVPKHFVECLNNRAEFGEKVWTGAYMIPAGPSGVGKADFLAGETLTPLWSRCAAAPVGGSCADWFAFIEQAKAMGGFLANQVVTDMKYTPVLAGASDWETFVVAGPGTQRGLNRLFGRDLKSAWNRDKAAEALQEVRAKVLSVAPEFAGVLRDLNNLSNCFCEFDKYERVRLGEGKPRARYVPAQQQASVQPVVDVGRFARTAVVVR